VAAVVILPSSIFPNVQLLVKRRWFTKGAEIDPNLAKVLPKVAHAFYTLMDFSVAPNCCCYLTFFHIPERSIALVKRLAGSPKGAEIDPNLPHAKVLPKVARILIYIDGLLQSHQTAAVILPSSIFRTFNCTSKRLAGSPKGAEIDPTCPTLTKSK
jgi:hypothetical protein